MKVFYDVPYSASFQDEEHLFNLYVPEGEGPFPLFLYFHGGGLINGSHRAQKLIWQEYLLDRGIAVASANYRHYPNAKYPQFIEDAAEAVCFMKKRACELAPISSLYVGGSSAGGYLSMMLCFDETYLGKHGISPNELDGFFFDAGQPTCHFNVLRERGFDRWRVMVNEAAPLYHVGTRDAYPPMFFLVSTEDIHNRLEETMLMLSALKKFGQTEPKVQHKIMESQHCKYVNKADENGVSVFGPILHQWIDQLENSKI